MEKQAKEETVVENATPDYAAGLVSTQVKLSKINQKINQSKKNSLDMCYSKPLKHVMVFNLLVETCLSL